ncbi:1-aminocyclopropane-1-carboxylate deaminase/D-cysteine desulfhydrase [Gilvimarinus sp. DA14]|uniref:1-aminocyclopropane-1-carboxylate deaminase/D-cysteine desulfhydrase n=1 Tax=Gilvimarinus sp. DA14 TaxID=2956798 RepID=UPI0020B8B591|nr:D-cysteine desulfhydrase family protein [Gilvimarinus sp. DA14]UTF60537.1 D-cysteine desulfhydrase family protein [Gilvimarinus sp. DA14]
MNRLNYPPRLHLAQLPTPLTPLHLPQLSGAQRLWIKRDDLTGSLLSGNKVRKLEFILAEAQGADTLITCGGLQSNHCRATAIIAAQQGLHCELILRGEAAGASDGNLLLAELAGAQVHTYSAQEYQRNLSQLLSARAEQLILEGRKPYIIPTGASDEVGLWGYVAAARELAEDFRKARIDNPLVVCAAGSGGTLAGLAVGLANYCPQAEVLGIAVCDNESYFCRRVEEDVQAAIARYPGSGLKLPVNFTINDAYIGPGYALGYPALFESISTLAAGSGIILDPVYTGKAFYGMLDLLERGELSQRDIVFVHTGGIFGVFPQRDNLQLRKV